MFIGQQIYSMERIASLIVWVNNNLQQNVYQMTAMYILVINLLFSDLDFEAKQRNDSKQCLKEGVTWEIRKQKLVTY